MVVLLFCLVSTESTGFHLEGWRAAAADCLVAEMARLMSQGKKKKEEEAVSQRSGMSSFGT